MSKRDTVQLEPLYPHGQHVLPIYAAGDRVAEGNASAEQVKKRGGLRLRPARGQFGKGELCTLTTVGYGDVYPVTVGGKLFTFFILVIGLGLIAVPVGLVSAALTPAREQVKAEALMAAFSAAPAGSRRPGGSLRR